MSKLTGEVGVPAQRQPEQINLEEYLEKLASKGLDANGHQIPDPVPIAPPIGYKRQPSMVEIVREAVRSEALRQAVAAAGHETFEEADDFDVGDDPELAHSPFENQFDPPIAEMVQAGAEEVKKRSKPPAAPKAPPKEKTPPADAGDVSGAPPGDDEV